jgi:phosphatidylglycerophosphate synthase
VTPAVLYLPQPTSHLLAARIVAGRSLAVRALVAAARAGAAAVGVPAALRSAELERALRRMPTVARIVRWLDRASPTEQAVFCGQPCVLLPACALVEARQVRLLFQRQAGRAGVALDASTASGAPVLLAPPALVARLWGRLVAGLPVGGEVARHVDQESPDLEVATGPFVGVRDEAGLLEAEAALYRNLGTEDDTGVDRLLHRRCSRRITRLLVRTPATPNQVSLASLAIGGLAIWAFWNATPVTALIGVVLYAIASVVDHADGEVARLTFQESDLGARLDWTIDTVIHSMIMLAIGVTAGGGPGLALGAAGAVGVTLSALGARHLPRETGVGESLGAALKGMGNRDFFYLMLLGFVLLRWTLPALLPVLVALVALGSQAYWIACLIRIRRGPPAA